MLAVQFERPARFDLAEHWKASTAELDRKRWSFRTVLSVRAEAIRPLEAWCVTRDANGEFSKRVGKGRAALEVDFDDERMARFFVLGMGSAVQVLEPEGLKDWVAREAKAVVEVLVEG